MTCFLPLPYSSTLETALIRRCYTAVVAKRSKYKQRRNPETSEEEWAFGEGLAYGLAVPEQVGFDPEKSFAYVRENWQADLEDELVAIEKMQKDSFGSGRVISAKALAEKLKAGVKAGIEAAITEHEAELPPEPEPVVAPANRGVVDVGYAKVDKSEHAPVKQAHRPQKRLIKRVALGTAGYMKRAAEWLDGYSLRPNPNTTQLWVARVSSRGLPDDPRDLTRWLIGSGVDVKTVVAALADTAERVFAHLWPHMPNAEALDDTLHLIRISNDGRALNARANWHERNANGLPCEQAARHILNMAIYASDLDDMSRKNIKLANKAREQILRMTNFVLRALVKCMDNTELDSHTEVWHTLARALIARR